MNNITENSQELFKQEKIVIEAKSLNFYYGKFQALKNINISIPANKVTALIGPSGCGKSTLLRIMNRMCDLVGDTRMEGSLKVFGREVYDPEYDVTELRRDVGMVFQHPNPFPDSVFENVAFGLKIAGQTSKKLLEEAVEKALSAVDLWNDLKDHLHTIATDLSADFQQRLCIARAIVIEPKILLMDEPCSSLDPIATQKIEELIFELKQKYTIVIVTHSMQQAARISDFAGCLILGELIEFDHTQNIFKNPKDKRTEDYISGKFG